jgi:hypothetical protein
MFVYDFLQLEVPFEAVRDRLLHVGATYDDDVAPDGGRVRLEVERAVEKDGMVAIPFRWRTQVPSPLFSSVDGHLEVSRLGATRTHVSLLGNYEPPGGYFGRRADRMGLHHLAEASLRAFLGRVAERLAGTAGTVAAVAPASP